MPRRAVAALAIIATLLALLVPVCRLWHLGTTSAGHAITASMPHALAADDARLPVAQCCSYDAAGTAAALAPAFGSPDPQPLAPPAIAVAFVAAAFVARRVPWRPPLPHTPSSFYLRSARILR